MLYSILAFIFLYQMRIPAGFSGTLRPFILFDVPTTMLIPTIRTCFSANRGSILPASFPPNWDTQYRLQGQSPVSLRPHSDFALSEHFLRRKASREAADRRIVNADRLVVLCEAISSQRHPQDWICHVTPDTPSHQLYTSADSKCPGLGLVPNR